MLVSNPEPFDAGFETRLPLMLTQNRQIVFRKTVRVIEYYREIEILNRGFETRLTLILTQNRTI